MVNLNATIFVQFGHFLIVWFLLDRYVFRILVSAVEQEKTEKIKLGRFVVDATKKVQAVQLLQEKQLQSYRSQFKKESPNIESELAHQDSFKASSLKIISQEEEQILVQEVKKEVARRMLDGK